MPILVMNPEEVATRLGITPETVREYLREGRILGFQVAGKWRVTETAFDAFVREMEQGNLHGERSSVGFRPLRKNKAGVDAGA
jgi:excisionase family DNA binding protein